MGGVNADEFGTLNKLLQRLERFWTDQIITDFNACRHRRPANQVRSSAKRPGHSEVIACVHYQLAATNARAVFDPLSSAEICNALPSVLASAPLWTELFSPIAWS